MWYTTNSEEWDAERSISQSEKGLLPSELVVSWACVVGLHLRRVLYDMWQLWHALGPDHWPAMPSFHSKNRISRGQDLLLIATTMLCNAAQSEPTDNKFETNWLASLLVATRASTVSCHIIYFRNAGDLSPIHYGPACLTLMCTNSWVLSLLIGP